MSKKFNILFVCTGNTCRSPLAKGILEKMLKESGVDFIEVESAGMGAFEGNPASSYAVETTLARDIDLSFHRSRRLNKEILRKADLVLAMSNEHLQEIKKLDEKSFEKTHLLKSFPRKIENKNFSIADPMGKGLDEYNLCFIQMEKEIKRIFPKLIELANKKTKK